MNDPTQQSGRRRLLAALAGWVVFVAIATFFAWRKRGAQVDDAFIYLRYARNLVEGRGWVYNEGEWVNGATSTGNTLLLTLASWFTGGRYGLAQILIFGVGLGSAAFFTWRLLRRMSEIGGILAALMVLTMPYLYWLVGMDTAPILGFATAAVWAYARGRLRVAAVAASLLVLTRPDGSLLVLLLLVHWLLVHRRELRTEWRRLGIAGALFLAPLVLWSVYSWLAFGTVLPKTLGAKLAQTASGLYGEGQIYLPNTVQNLLLFLSIRLGSLNFLWLAVLVVLAMAGLVTGTIRRQPVMALALWGLVQCVAYAILNLPNYLWYYLPANLVLAVGLGVLVAWLWGKTAGRPPAARIALRGAVILVALAWLVPTVPDPRDVTAASHPGYLHYRSDSHYPHYYELAQWLRAQEPGGSSLACAEIGVLGFELPKFRIVDMWGLVTRGGVEAISRGDFTWWFAEPKPCYVLFHDPPWEGPEKAVLALPAFHAEYELVRQEHGLVFRRRQG